MKALSLMQPWATLVALGEKKIETRSWKTNYRGELYIHASKRFPRQARELCMCELFQSSLLNHKIFSIDSLPLGAIIALVELKDVVLIDQKFRGNLSDKEHHFGDYRNGRYAWLLEPKYLVTPPYITKGAVGLWESNLYINKWILNFETRTEFDPKE